MSRITLLVLALSNSFGRIKKQYSFSKQLFYSRIFLLKKVATITVSLKTKAVKDWELCLKQNVFQPLSHLENKSTLKGGFLFLLF